MKILVADHDLTSRLILEATLKKLGHEVTAAKNGVEALKLFESENISVVISDMVMPEMHGLQLCQHIRAARRSQYTYFLLLTRISGKSGYLVGMKAGADDLLAKPFDEDLLVARLVVAERILNLQSQVKQPGGLLPICPHCKKIRDDKNYWQPVESHIGKRGNTRFTHSDCPDCVEERATESRFRVRSGDRNAIRTSSSYIGEKTP